MNRFSNWNCRGNLIGRAKSSTGVNQQSKTLYTSRGFGPQNIITRMEFYQDPEMWSYFCTKLCRIFNNHMWSGLCFISDPKESSPLPFPMLLSCYFRRVLQEEFTLLKHQRYCLNHLRVHVGWLQSLVIESLQLSVLPCFPRKPSSFLVYLFYSVLPNLIGPNYHSMFKIILLLSWWQN